MSSSNISPNSGVVTSSDGKQVPSASPLPAPVNLSQLSPPQPPIVIGSVEQLVGASALRVIDCDACIDNIGDAGATFNRAVSSSSVFNTLGGKIERVGLIGLIRSVCEWSTSVVWKSRSI